MSERRSVVRSQALGPGEAVSPYRLEPAAEPRQFFPAEFGRSPWPSEHELAQIREKARSQGEAQGRAEAQARFEVERAEQRRAAQDLLARLATPFDAMEDRDMSDLAELALALGQTLFAGALAAQPEQVAQIVREAIAALPVRERSLTVSLHPDDLPLCEDLLADGREVQLVADDSLERGGCRVSTETSVVDASVESRLETLASALGLVR